MQDKTEAQGGPRSCLSRQTWDQPQGECSWLLCYPLTCSSHPVPTGWLAGSVETCQLTVQSSEGATPSLGLGPHKLNEHQPTAGLDGRRHLSTEESRAGLLRWRQPDRGLFNTHSWVSTSKRWVLIFLCFEGACWSQVDSGLRVMSVSLGAQEVLPGSPSPASTPTTHHSLPLCTAGILVST